MQSFYQRVKDELLLQWKTSIPASLNAMGNSLPWLISIAFVGRIGAKELAAAALATSICNVTGLSLSMGLSSAVTTLTGQSKGDMMQRRQRLKERRVCDNKNISKPIDTYESIPKEDKTQINANMKWETIYPMTPKTYLYRGFFIQILFVLPVGIYWIYGIKQALLSLGQDETISEMAQDYLRILTPGFWCYSLNFTLSCWLQAIGMADIPVYGVMVGTIFHIPMNILFIYTFECGYLGAAIASSIFRFFQPLVSTILICFTERGQSRIYTNTGEDTLDSPIPLCIEINRAFFSFRGICQHLSLALPGVVIISTWWASEITIFLSGRLSSPATALAGMTIYQSIINFFYKFSAGVSVACSTRVSNLLGAGDANAAKFASKVSVFYAVIACFGFALLLYFLPHEFIPSLFTPDTDIINEVSMTLPFISLYVFADGMQLTINGIIKGCGKQCIVMPIVLVAYWMIGLPLAYYMAFIWGKTYTSFHGITGLVFGMTVGAWSLFTLVALTVAVGTNWEKEVMKAKARLGLEQVFPVADKKSGQDEKNKLQGSSSEERLPLNSTQV